MTFKQRELKYRYYAPTNNKILLLIVIYTFENMKIDKVFDIIVRKRLMRKLISINLNYIPIIMKMDIFSVIILTIKFLKLRTHDYKVNNIHGYKVGKYV